MATGLFTSIHDWQNEYTAHLSSDITNVSTDINLDSVPTPTEGCLVIDPDTPANTEIIFYTSKTSSKVTVPSVANGRGYDGTTAIAHLSGTKVIMAPIADDFRYVRTQVTNAQAGWTQLTTATLTFTSYDSTNKTGVIGTSIDLTGTISVGMKLRFTNNSSTQYCFVTATSASTVTVYFGTDYSLTNSAITVPYYSVQKAPFGFPLDPAKWTVTFTNSTDQTQTATGNTWYNIGSLSITVPIGAWIMHYGVYVDAFKATATSLRAFVSISTSNSSQVDSAFQTGFVSGGASGTITVGGVATCPTSKTVNVAAATPYYLIALADQTTSASGLRFLGSTYKPTVIEAVCSYL